MPAMQQKAAGTVAYNAAVSGCILESAPGSR